MFELPQYNCTRCGHRWIPRNDKLPKVCPKCKSPYWNKPYAKKGFTNERQLNDENTNKILSKSISQSKLTTIDDFVSEKPENIVNANFEKQVDTAMTSIPLASSKMDYVKAFIYSISIVGSPTSSNSYIYTLREFEKFVSKPLNEVVRTDIERFFNYKLVEQEKPVSRATCRTIQNRLKSLYRWMVDREYMVKNPTVGIRQIQFAKKEPVFLELDEIETLLKVADIESPREGMMIRFLFLTGVRTSELVKFRKSDISQQNMTITIMGKGMKERKVRIPPWFMDILIEYCKGFKNNQKLFEYHTSTVQDDFRKLVKMAGIPPEKHVTPYTLRHSFATHMLRGGANIVVIQKLLGHTSVSTTQIYTHVTDAEQIDAYLKAHPMSQNRI